MRSTDTRRRPLLVWIGALAVGVVCAPVLAQSKPGRIQATAKPQLEVWKDPSCGCCQDWIAYMEKSGFAVKVHDSGNNARRAQLGIAQQYGSCHTATVGGYAVEGHVPASDILRLLKERPAGIGLAVPGMPIGSPGMDGPEYGGRRDAYQVLLLQADGSSSVFQNHEGNKA